MSRSAVEVLERPQTPKAAKEGLMRREDEDEEAEDDVDMEDDDEQSEKDETEIELERLVFGDSAGFRDGLKGSALALREGEESEEGTGLDGLDDADVGQALTTQRLPCLVC